MRGEMGNSIITTILASVGGGIITWVATRIFSKSEDSASKEYVDSKCEKLEDKLVRKIDREDFYKIIEQMNASQAEMRADIKTILMKLK